jgi:hypothetical protein
VKIDLSDLKKPISGGALQSGVGVCRQGEPEIGGTKIYHPEENGPGKDGGANLYQIDGKRVNKALGAGWGLKG